MLRRTALVHIDMPSLKFDVPIIRMRTSNSWTYTMSSTLVFSWSSAFKCGLTGLRLMPANLHHLSLMQKSIAFNTIDMKAQCTEIQAFELCNYAFDSGLWQFLWTISTISSATIQIQCLLTYGGYRKQKLSPSSCCISQDIGGEAFELSTIGTIYLDFLNRPPEGVYEKTLANCTFIASTKTYSVLSKTTWWWPKVPSPLGLGSQKSYPGVYGCRLSRKSHMSLNRTQCVPASLTILTWFYETACVWFDTFFIFLWKKV